jgi:DNA-binding GntR family transcriptional regulator
MDTLWRLFHPDIIWIMVSIPNSSPIRLPSITDVIYQTLRREIQEGSLQPGPISMRDLAAKFGVSAMPVREALRRLEADGIVSFNMHRRIMVNHLSVDDLEELFAIRIELESLALRCAIPTLRDDDETLAQLEELIRQMDTEEGDLDAWRAHNHEFHRLLYSQANMPRLQGIIDSLWVSIEPYLRLHMTVEGIRIAQGQHRAILRHTRAADAIGAGVILREHLQMTLDRRRDRLAALGGDQSSGDRGLKSSEAD